MRHCDILNCEIALGFRLVTRKMRIGKKRTQRGGPHSEDSHVLISRLKQQLELPDECPRRFWGTLVGTPVGICRRLNVYLARAA